MQNYLDEIKATPGVLGSSVYTSKSGIIATNLPEIFKPEAQQRIGNILHRIFKLNKTVQLDVNSFEIQYDEALLLIKKLCDTSALIIICEPDAKTHLINMSVSMLAVDLRNAIDDCILPPDPAAKSSMPPADPESVLNGPLSETLTLMRRSLAKRIGPVAGKALKSAVEKWLEQGEPTAARLGDLAEIMQTEIDDSPSQAAFLAEVRNLIS